MIEKLKIPSKNNPKSLFLFLMPIIVATGLFLLLNPSCQAPGGETTGSLKLLYTSEVAGRLDPCG